jgi:outer membrane protein TolC
MATSTRTSSSQFVLLIGLSLASLNVASTIWAQSAPAQMLGGINNSPNANNAPLTLTLQDALQRAQKINPEYRLAVTDFGLAREDRVQSRAALLPNANYNAAFLYTQGTGRTAQTPKFIANNGVHEYVSQGNVHQDLSLGKVADYQRAAAAMAVARARAEIAARGLVVTVVRTYYGFVTAQQKYANTQRATTEAQRFLNVSQKLEHAGEVAHSDVIKAELQARQQERELQNAELEMNRSRLELAVLVFPDFNQNFTVIDDLQTPEPLPALSEIQNLAGRNNPDLAAAMATMRLASQEVKVAWYGFFPSLSLDYFYGIDANQFAVRAPDGARNLGYAATASLQLPVWNWGASRSKVKQANLRKDLAQVELSFTQRRLLANLQAFYGEAQTARSQMDSLNQSAELAAESLRLTTLRYQAGEATVLEVVDAQNTLTGARNALNDGRVRYWVGIANLQTLTGAF